MSAKKDDIDKIRGLGLGADDYMTKPFSPSELVARVKAHLARYERLIGSNAEENQIIEIRGLKIDTTARRVWVNGEEKSFTTKEFDLLTFLAGHPNHVYTKEELFREIWDMESIGDIATVTVHIKKIREKIEYDTSHPQYIETIWGVDTGLKCSCRRGRKTVPLFINFRGFFLQFLSLSMNRACVSIACERPGIRYDFYAGCRTVKAKKQEKKFMEEKKKSPRRIRLTTMQIVALGFFGVIFLGGVLLWLPFSNQKPIEFIDALFTSVTCVCVTGLVTVVPAEQFTLAGQVIMMLLIQIGGLGVIACMASFFLILGKRISMKGRILIQQAYGLDTLSGLVKFIIRILKGTFLVEGIGAALFMFKFIPEFGVLRGIWYGVFHSISAFCNAGVDIIGNSSFMEYVSSPLINFTTMFLIGFGRSRIYGMA